MEKSIKLLLIDFSTTVEMTTFSIPVCIPKEQKNDFLYSSRIPKLQPFLRQTFGIMVLDKSNHGFPYITP